MMNVRNRCLGVLSVSLLSSGLVQAMVQKNEAQQIKKLSQHVEAVPGEFLVKFYPSIQSAQSNLAKFASDLGVEVKSVVLESESLYRVAVVNSAKIMTRGQSKNLEVAAVAALQKIPGVERVEPNYIYRTADISPSQISSNDPDFTKLWGLHNQGQVDSGNRAGLADADIDAPEAWQISTGSRKVVVAIIDTGIDYSHPDLAANAWVKPGSENKPIHGFNAISGVEDPRDDNSHGTHCAGTIGAKGDNNQGVVGVNWDVSLMGVKFLSAGGSGTLEDAIKAIDYAVKNGANVLSNSWGGGAYSEFLLDAIKRAQHQGILFVAAAGNNSNDNDAAPSYPASYNLPNVVSVAASNNQEQLAYFSNYGRNTVHVAAPGENIWSTVLKNGYASYSGTSMATPHVAGAAALLLAHDPSLGYADLKARLISSGDKISIYNRSVVQGSRLNLYNLLANINPPGDLTPPNDAWSSTLVVNVSTPHPYLENTKKRWEISHPGATYIRLQFAKFDLEKKYDTLKIINADTGVVVEELHGLLVDNSWTVELKGSHFYLDFASDNSINKYGFDLNGYQWTQFH